MDAVHPVNLIFLDFISLSYDASYYAAIYLQVKVFSLHHLLEHGEQVAHTYKTTSRSVLKVFLYFSL
jgi:hypothetical protein